MTSNVVFAVPSPLVFWRTKWILFSILAPLYFVMGKNWSCRIESSASMEGVSCLLTVWECIINHDSCPSPLLLSAVFLLPFWSSTVCTIVHSWGLLQCEKCSFKNWLCITNDDINSVTVYIAFVTIFLLWNLTVKFFWHINFVTD